MSSKATDLGVNQEESTARTEARPSEALTAEEAAEIIHSLMLEDEPISAGLLAKLRRIARSAP